MINYLIILTILIYSSWTDFKTKEVSNKTILLGLIIGLILNPIIFIQNFLIGLIIFYILWKIGGFGAGDSKLFILYTGFFGLIQASTLFIITGTIFVFYNFLLKKQEKRLVPFILIAFVIKIIIYILLYL